MPQVTLTPGATGTDIELSAPTAFYVVKGSVDVSTDSGTTYLPFSAGEKFIMSGGLTVRPRNGNAVLTSIFRHMSF